MQNNRSNRRIWLLFLLLIIPILCIAAVIVFALPASAGTDNVLTDLLSEPLNGVTAAKMDIDVGDGNLNIDWLTGGETLLAGGTLQYPEKAGQPARSMNSINNQATFWVKAGKGPQRWINFPWEECNGATSWDIHLNPSVLYDLTAHSNGGNLRLNLSGLILSHLSAATGGGNVEVDLPETSADLSVTAKTGAGNVIIRVPEGTNARIHVSTGLGKTIVDPRYQKINETTYQTPGYEDAEKKVEITAETGAGNVSIEAK